MSQKIPLSEAAGLLCQAGINAEPSRLRRLARQDLLSGVNPIVTPTGRLYFDRDELQAVGQVYLMYFPGAEAA